jgi:hypothetical protein
MLAVGVNVDFAPDADVLPESGPSGIDDRSFGSDPQRAGTLVAAAVKGYQSAGLAATIKHFPGIGRTATDTHKALPTLDESCEEWNAVESVPMRAGVDAGVALVMTGHIALPAIGVDGQSSALAGAAVTDLLKGGGVADPGQFLRTRKIGESVDQPGHQSVFLISADQQGCALLAGRHLGLQLRRHCGHLVRRAAFGAVNPALRAHQNDAPEVQLAHQVGTDGVGRTDHHHRAGLIFDAHPGDGGAGRGHIRAGHEAAGRDGRGRYRYRLRNRWRRGWWRLCRCGRDS